MRHSRDALRALHVRGLPVTIGAAGIMGAAVTGMHYVGMAALHVTATAATDPTGWVPGMPVTSEDLTGGMLLVVAMAPTDRELREEMRRRRCRWRCGRGGSGREG